MCLKKVEGLEEVVTTLMGEEEGSSDLLNQDNLSDDLATWKDSRIFAELETLLASTDKDTNTGKRKREQRHDSQEVEHSTSTAQYRIVPLADSNTPLLAYHSPLPRAPLASSGLLELPVEMPRYLDHYFAYTHCFLPILDRTGVFRAYFGLSKGIPPESSQAEITLLQAIAAFTSRELDDSQPPNPGRTASSDWAIKSISNIPSDPDKLDVSYIQALILLSLLDIGEGRWERAWIMVGRAVRHSLQHSVSGQQRRNADTILLQACQILDTIVAAHLMFPPHLRRLDLDRIGHAEEDGPEEWEPWIKPTSQQTTEHQPAFIMSCFNRLSDVCAILNDAMMSTHLSGTLRRGHYEDLSQRLNELDVQMQNAAPLGPQSPPHFFIGKMFHLSASISVFRFTLEHDLPHLPLAQMACKTLAVLKDFLNSQVSSHLSIPPVLENPVRAACYAVIACKPVFGTSGELPTYKNFAQEMTTQILQLSTRWTVFKPLSGLWQSQLQSAASEVQPATPFSQTGPPQESFPFLRRGAFENSYSSAGWSFGNTFPPRSLSTSQPQLSSVGAADGAFSTRITNANAPVVGNDMNLPGSSTQLQTSGVETSNWLQETTSLATNPYDTAMSGIDVTSSAVSTSQTAPIVPSSPSFQGDDVDAIFHNLVYLDANDWTATRAGGFHDLGFADDLTFQAFCDDPERLAQPAGGSTQQSMPTLGLWQPDAALSYNFDNFNATY